MIYNIGIAPKRCVGEICCLVIGTSRNSDIVIANYHVKNNGVAYDMHNTVGNVNNLYSSRNIFFQQLDITYHGSSVQLCLNMHWLRIETCIQFFYHPVSKHSTGLNQ